MVSLVASSGADMGPNLEQFLVNLKFAAWNGQTISVGGGLYTPKEIKEILEDVKKLVDNQKERE